MVLRDGHKGDFFRDGGLLAYGEYVIGEKRVHDVLRGMPLMAVWIRLATGAT